MNVAAVIALVVFAFLLGVIVTRVMNSIVDIQREIFELRSDLKMPKQKKPKREPEPETIGFYKPK